MKTLPKYYDKSVLKLKKTDCREILLKTFPNYRGRKFKLNIKEKYYISDSYWDGGSRTYTKIICFETGKIIQIPEMKYEGKEFDILDNMLIVENSTFCGKRIGITIICSPNSEFIKGKNLISN